jgi:hypothetical protein
MLSIYSKQKTTGSLLDSVLNANDNMARIILENKELFRAICLIFTKTNALTLKKNPSSTEYKKVQICTKNYFLSCFNEYLLTGLSQKKKKNIYLYLVVP